jgi:hypothetical protein
MFRLLRLFLGLVCRSFYSRRDLLLENLVLRQQLSVFQQRKQRPKLTPLDKLFWVGIKRIWSQWRNSLVRVAPETVVAGSERDFENTGTGVLATRLAAGASARNCASSFCR